MRLRQPGDASLPGRRGTSAALWGFKGLGLGLEAKRLLP